VRIVQSCKRRGVRRAAFTLVELLAVIAIIGILMALSAGAFFRVRVQQQESATNVTLQKLQSELDTQWKTVMDNANDDARTRSISPSIISWAGNDDRRAKVVWSKILLRVEFPQTFFDATDPVNGFPAQMKALNFNIPIKSSYFQATQGMTSAPVANPGYPQAHYESAALLYISLTQGRRGMKSFNPTEQVGPHAIGTVDLYGKQLNVFVDTWGTPIAFIRWPTSAAGSDLNDSSQPFQVFNTISGVKYSVDPQDPELTLNDPSWTNQSGFSKSIHALNPNGPLNLSPFVFSAGRDKDYGVDALYGNATAGELDNLYGYRLRGVGRK
jgi:prepilin-type N-terminal cleavage/methylation domain-containing protein